MSNFKDKKPPKGRVLYKDKKHVQGVEGNRGLPGESLKEPVPEFAKRAGDLIINAKTMNSGEDNNTMIIMGRDRTGKGEYQYKDKLNFTSGYGTHMGAGAIDIVVGRMAPFAITSVNGDKKTKAIKMGPAHVTKEYPENDPLRTVQIGNYNKDGTLEKMFDHPGVVMDAARIYISQMCLIDDYFKIAKEIYAAQNIFAGPPVPEDQKRPSPIGSAIMIKADEVRLHSRKDIKIVTGGPGENWDSQGNRNTVNGKIHLMAGNLAHKQQPVVLGNNLVELLNRFLNLFEDYVTNVNSFVTQQLKYNADVAGHVHTELGAQGLPVLPSLVAMKSGAETTYFQLANNVIGGGLAVGATIGKLKALVIPGEAKINSETVTTS